MYKDSYIRVWHLLLISCDVVCSAVGLLCVIIFRDTVFLQLFLSTYGLNHSLSLSTSYDCLIPSTTGIAVEVTLNWRNGKKSTRTGPCKMLIHDFWKPHWKTSLKVTGLFSPDKSSTLKRSLQQYEGSHWGFMVRSLLHQLRLILCWSHYVWLVLGSLHHFFYSQVHFFFFWMIEFLPVEFLQCADRTTHCLIYFTS